MSLVMRLGRTMAALPRRFAAESQGAVALIFGLAILPLTMAVGAAVDYSRASQMRVDLQSATDAAAIAVGRAAIELGRLDNKVQARQAFDAGFQPKGGATVTRFDVTQTTSRITIDANATIPLAFAGVIGITSMTVNAQAVVPLDDITLEVALVLDNTGSMGQSGKMDALKTASKALITKVENASKVNTKASVAIVPFATQIRVPESNPAPPWVRFKHSGDGPEPDIIAENPSWRGCIFDRDQPYDANSTPPSTAVVATLHPAARCRESNLAIVLPLNRRFNALRSHIDSMTPGGNTNTTIGLAAGLAVLTPNTIIPTGAQVTGRFVKKHMIFLTDGENTQNRWTTNRAQIDRRTELLCTDIKQPRHGIVVHTILLMEGNATLLQNCATTPNRYYFVTAPEQLNEVFDAIAAEMLSVRLTH